MIVISGALVLTALVLLVIGILDTNLPFVYGSIAVSLASLLSLFVGVLQRRKETFPGQEVTERDLTSTAHGDDHGVASGQGHGEPNRADELATILAQAPAGSETVRAGSRRLPPAPAGLEGSDRPEHDLADDDGHQHPHGEDAGARLGTAGQVDPEPHDDGPYEGGSYDDGADDDGAVDDEADDDRADDDGADDSTPYDDEGAAGRYDEQDDGDDDGDGTTGSGPAPSEPTVLVVDGRPRYHLGECRYLISKQAQVLGLHDAREIGFTPCGVCKPDSVLDQDEPEPDAPAGHPAEQHAGRAGAAAASDGDPDLSFEELLFGEPVFSSPKDDQPRQASGEAQEQADHDEELHDEEPHDEPTRAFERPSFGAGRDEQLDVDADEHAHAEDPDHTGGSAGLEGGGSDGEPASGWGPPAGGAQAEHHVDDTGTYQPEHEPNDATDDDEAGTARQSDEEVTAVLDGPAPGVDEHAVASDDAITSDHPVAGPAVHDALAGLEPTAGDDADEHARAGDDPGAGDEPVAPTAEHEATVPAGGAAAGTARLQDGDADRALTDAFPVEASPVETAPAETSPEGTAPAGEAPATGVPAKAPVERAPVTKAPAKKAPAKKAPAKKAPAKKAPAKKASAKKAPAKKAPAEKAPAPATVQAATSPAKASAAKVLAKAPAAKAPAKAPVGRTAAKAPAKAPAKTPAKAAPAAAAPAAGVVRTPSGTTRAAAPKLPAGRLRTAPGRTGVVVAPRVTAVRPPAAPPPPATPGRP